MNLHVPKQNLPYTKREKLVDLGCGAFMLLMFVYVWQQLSGLPEMVPAHFDLSGTVNSYRPKDSLFILPGVALFTLFMVSLSRLDPRYMNIPVRVTETNALKVFTAARQMLMILQVLLTVFFGIFVYFTIEVSKSVGSRLPMFPAYVFVAGLLLVITFSMIRIRKIARTHP